MCRSRIHPLCKVHRLSPRRLHLSERRFLLLSFRIHLFIWCLNYYSFRSCPAPANQATQRPRAPFILFRRFTNICHNPFSLIVFRHINVIYGTDLRMEISFMPVDCGPKSQITSAQAAFGEGNGFAAFRCGADNRLLYWTKQKDNHISRVS